MPTKKKPNPTNKSTIGDKSRKALTKHGGKTKPQLEHMVKLGLMKDSQMFGKKYDATKLYFESKGFTLGNTQFTDLRNELKSADNAKEWFSKEALFVIEEDHMLSVERIRMLEDRLMQEFEQVAATNFYKYLNEGTEEQEIIRNKSHDGQFLLRIVAQFQSLQETKTKMFSATPLVQELMEVHRQQEEERETPSYQPKEEKKEIYETRQAPEKKRPSS